MKTKSRNFKTTRCLIAALAILTGAQLGSAQGNSRRPDDLLKKGEVWARLQPALTKFGDRLEKPGKERVVLTGTLTRGAAAPYPVEVIWQFPGLLRLSEQAPGGTRISVFNGSTVSVAGGSRNDEGDRLLEALLYDSAEGFFTLHTRQGGTQFLGTRYRLDVGPKDPFKGPFYDLYEVLSATKVRPTPLRQTRLYFVDADTSLLGLVRRMEFRAGVAVNLETRIEWQQIGDQSLPKSFVCRENGSLAWRLDVTVASTRPTVPDGIFDHP